METHEVSSHLFSLADPALIIALPGRQDILTSSFTLGCLAPPTRTAGSLSYQSSSKRVELSRSPVYPFTLTRSVNITGNLRSYIHDKGKPFPWRLRLSFSTDIARALAYLHARRCIHRDLKGENLLVTSNGRLKITDFGFARIAARNADESKRLTFCGTDSYMSPEILLGNEFDLPTDIYSLGVIFCEITSRKLADDNTFKRSAPDFAIDQDEIRNLASPGCPSALIQLCIDCLAHDPSQRPTTRVILDRLREIEVEVLSRPSEADDLHVGTIKFMTGTKRPNPAPRIPSFGMGVGKDISDGSPRSDYASDESDEEAAQAVEQLSKVGLTSAWSGKWRPFVTAGAYCTY
jgi:LIM domain kinase 1